MSALAMDQDLQLLRKQINFAIQKLTKELNRKIKNKKRNKTNIEIELKELMTADPFEISKKALLNERKPEEIINDYNTLPNERVIARIFNNKFIKKYTAELILKFDNDTTLKGWRDLLSHIGSKKAKKLANKLQNRKKKEEKSKEVHLLNDRMKWLLENGLIENDEIITEVKNSYKKPIQVKEIPKVREPNEDKIIKNEKKIKVQKIGIETLKLNLENKIKDDIPEIDQTEPEEKEKENEVVEERMMVDNFFFNSAGENFISSTKERPKIEVIEKNIEDDGSFYQNNYSKQNRFRESNNSFEKLNKFKNGDNSNSNFRNKRFKRDQWNDKPNYSQDNGDNGYGQQDTAEVKRREEIDETLHPSWIAKLKQKPIMVEFKGKKTVFDDGPSSEVKNSDRFTKYKPPIPNKVDETLHPSWIAKLNQKPIMVEFQGTKTVFD